MRKRVGTWAIPAVAAACLLLAAIGAYGRYAILDEGHFAARATGTLQSDEVREAIADRIATRVVAARPDLTRSEPAIHDAASDLAAGFPFAVAFRDASARLHRVLFADADTDAPLTIAGSGGGLQQALEGRLTGAAPRLGDQTLLTVRTDQRERTLRALAPRARRADLPLTIGFGVAALALLGFACVRSGSRRRAVWTVSLTVAAAAGLAALAVIAGRDVLLSHFDTSFGDTVVSQVWGAYLGDLRTWGLAVCAGALAVAAVAGGPRPAPRAALRIPATTSGRVLRVAGLLALAAIAVDMPELLVHVAMVTLAAALVYVAAGDLRRVIA
jgi:hypothetical protein